MDKINNECIRGTDHVKQFLEHKTRGADTKVLWTMKLSDKGKKKTKEEVYEDGELGRSCSRWA